MLIAIIVAIYSYTSFHVAPANRGLARDTRNFHGGVLREVEAKLSRSSLDTLVL